MSRITKKMVLKLITNELDQRVALWNAIKKETKEASCNDDSAIRMASLYTRLATLPSLEGQIKVLQELYFKIENL